MAVPGVSRQDVHGGGQHRGDHRSRVGRAGRFRVVRGRRHGRHARRSGDRRRIESGVFCVAVGGTVRSTTSADRVPPEPDRQETQVSEVLPVTGNDNH